MEAVLLLALGIGSVSGLRVFTSLAALALVRGGVWSYVVAVIALGEYVADASPNIPSRTALPSIAIRPLSGAVAGWLIAAMHGGSTVLAAVGAVCGVIGAFAGTYGGHAARLWAIARIGAIPAALAEDVLAIALAAFLVTR